MRPKQKQPSSEGLRLCTISVMCSTMHNFVKMYSMVHSIMQVLPSVWQKHLLPIPILCSLYPILILLFGANPDCPMASCKQLSIALHAAHHSPAKQVF